MLRLNSALILAALMLLAPAASPLAPARPLPDWQAGVSTMPNSGESHHSAATADALEHVENPSVRRSPLSVMDAPDIQGRGTVLPLELDRDSFDSLRFEQALRLDGFTLPASRRGENVRSVSLQLERLPVLSERTQIVLGDPAAPDRIAGALAAPEIAMYRGTIVGEPDSRVFLSLSPVASYGYIRSAGQTHLISPGPRGEGRELLIYNHTAMPPGAIPWRDFACQTESVTMDRIELPAGQVAGDGAPCRRAELALETDAAFTDDLFGGDQEAAAVYAATLIGAVTEIYLDQLNTFFEITFLRLWSGDDIWTQENSGDQLFEFRDVWQEEMTHVDRHLAHFLSGRDLGGGVAWLSAICHDTQAYGLSGNLNGFFPYPLQNNNDQNWDVMVVAHELGHNFGSPHTHDVCPPIDQCAPESFFGECQDETVCISNGTIMSYCHTCSGGTGNIMLEFHAELLPFMHGFLDSIDDASCPLSTGSTTCVLGEGCDFAEVAGGVNNTAWALVSYNGDLVAGGDFTQAGGAPANRVAQFDGISWLSLGTGMNNTVRALAVYNSDLYAGGLFTIAGGQAVNRIARWDGANWNDVGGGVSGGGGIPRIFDFAIFQGDLIAAGTFTTAGGQTANRIARWDGAAWHDIGGGMNNNVYALAIYDNQLIAAGSFTNAGGVAANRIARWNGTNWQTLGTGMNDIVFSLAVHQGELVAGGEFTTAGGLPANRVARWNGSDWQPLDTGMNDLVQTLLAHGGALFAGGSFSVAGGTIASRVARWDGEQWQPVAVGVNNIVRAMTTFDGQIAVGGSFTFVGGMPIDRIALFDCPDLQEPPAPGDLNGDGSVGVADLLALLGQWGPCADCNDCPADINGDCTVGVADLLALLGLWG